jgi:hypothetical protein
MFFLNKIYLGVYTRVYVLLLLLIFKKVQFWINHANIESSYVLITMMHNVIYDIVMPSWNLYVDIKLLDDYMMT